MVRVSNCLITLLNLLTLLVATAALLYASTLYTKVETPCEKMVRRPLYLSAGVLMAVSIAGMMGACCGISFFMWIYLVTVLAVIVVITLFSIFSMLVMNRGMSQALSGKQFGDRKMEDYNTWLEEYVLDKQNWERVRSCLWHVKICSRIEGGMTEYHYQHNLPPLLSGCCKPPNYCKMEFVNATTWVMPKSGAAEADPDCKAWSNEAMGMCFECESCKVAVVNSIRKEWRVMSLVNTCTLICLSIIYSIGCCALRNNRHH